VVEETAYATMTTQASTATPKSTNTSTSVPTATPARTATPSPSPTATFEITTLTRSQDGMLMVFVPAGDFTMGSPAGEGGDDEVPQHKVTLDSFWIDRTEVTNAQYRVFVGATSHQAPSSCDGGDPTFDDEAKANQPVVCVNWDDAQAYCEWAGGQLPTEAQWEKAARGTDERAYPWGNSFDGSRVNYCDTNCEFDQKDTSADDGYGQAAPVGSYPTGASPYGALDMAGNVWEWVSDWYKFYYYSNSPQHNPQGPDAGKYRVLRGGSWFGYSTNARSGFRAWSTPDKRHIVIGFRCVVPSTPSP
jgi:formylglycine-generating enzyme required for sulfatase activity